ncbi:MAG: integrase core domain-containing protein [Reinekea sp.]
MLRIRTRRKPQWVIDEVIYLKTVNPVLSGRKIADLFNRRFAISRNMTVSKSYVYDKLKQHRYQIQILRRHLKHKRPKALPKNIFWGLDLTTVADDKGNQHQILGIIDYGTRRCLCLQNSDDKRSIILLKHILKAILLFGKPKAIKTDNEAVFTLTLFELGLKGFGIKHQKSDIAGPWQNGRIERFFGTFKKYIRQLSIHSLSHLTHALPEFPFYYHAVRPHQYLNRRANAR